jgi:hypothetical protein
MGSDPASEETGAMNLTKAHLSLTSSPLLIRLISTNTLTTLCGKRLLAHAARR